MRAKLIEPENPTTGIDADFFFDERSSETILHIIKRLKAEIPEYQLDDLVRYQVVGAINNAP